MAVFIKEDTELVLDFMIMLKLIFIYLNFNEDVNVGTKHLICHIVDGINYMKIDNYTIDKEVVWIKAHIN